MDRGVLKSLATHCIVLALGVVAGSQVPSVIHKYHLVAERAQIREQIKQEPKDANSWASLGVLESDLGNRDSALESFSTALSYDPSNFQALLGTGNIFVHEKNYAVAKQWYEKLLKAAQDSKDTIQECEAQVVLEVIQSR